MSNTRTQETTGTSSAVDEKTERPPLYKVYLHNDDYTTMDFVIMVIRKFFNKSYDEAYELMLKVHHEGVAVCGIYTLEIAETKAQQVMRVAKENSHPLRCTIGPE